MCGTFKSKQAQFKTSENHVQICETNCNVLFLKKNNVLKIAFFNVTSADFVTDIEGKKSAHFWTKTIKSCHSGL